MCPTDAACEEAAMTSDEGPPARPATRAELRALFGKDYAEGLGLEAQRRWGGSPPWRQARDRTALLTAEEWTDLRDQGRRITDEFAAHLRRGVPPYDPDVLAVAERQRRFVEQVHDCPPELHRDLADLYTGDARLARRYDRVEPGLADYVWAAVHANADRLARESDRRDVARVGQPA
jgi:hypothetical protein